MKKMKRSLSFIAGLVLVLGLVFNQANTTFAAINESQPSLSEVTSLAKETASYVLSEDSALLTSVTSNSEFRTISRDLILANQVGLDVSSQINTFLETAKTLFAEGGLLNEASNTSGYYAANYAELIELVNITNQDASNFNGVNLYAAFNDSLKDVTVANLSDSKYFNPYLISEIHACLSSYSANLTDYETINANLNEAVMTITDANGVVYWGYSADNDGNTLSGFTDFYNSNSEFAAIIDSLVAKHTSTTATSDGTVYTDPETGAVYSWGALNPDSTALSLAFLSEYGDATAAAIKYNALVENFKSSTTTGAFIGYDSLYSSRDALIGLAAYLQYGNLVDATVDTNTETETATANSVEASQVAANQDTVSTSETSASDVKAADNSMANVFVILMAASAVLLVVTTKKNAEVK
ncbi:hypothetical protein [Lachnospira sp.]|jgi:hypothetical protein|uniref:hypothetical protein n=1 Tax=Lachnospira sp. TaxID=2049031 RepID=UPI0025811BB5|nr:hypothetical protein [Lachnospira sp.]